jgi:hypothetical protein
MGRKVLYHSSFGKDPRFSASDATTGYLLSRFLSLHTPRSIRCFLIPI